MIIDVNKYSRRNIVMRAEAARWYCRAINTATNENKGPEAIWEASKLSFDFRRRAVDMYILECYGLTVQSGPFEGMVYIDGASGSLYSPKILGCYEMELHQYINRLPTYRRFVDVGCAEGYYAVGAKYLAPNLDVYAFDVESGARERCRALAKANGISDGLFIESICSPDTLADLAIQDTLVLIDIEGAEVELLTGVPASRLALCDFLIETHAVSGLGLTLEAIVSILSETHDIAIVDHQPRDWRPFDALRRLGQVERFLAQWEGRGPEPWIFAKHRV